MYILKILYLEKMYFLERKRKLYEIANESSYIRRNIFAVVNI